MQIFHPSNQAVPQTSMSVFQNPLTSESVKQLIAEGNNEELQKCFGARMEFGTAGLRAPMGAGISRMNDLTIIQTTQVPGFGHCWLLLMYFLRQLIDLICFNYGCEEVDPLFNL